MINFLVWIGIICSIGTSAYAGEPFQCNLFSEDRAFNKSLLSTPIEGHGLKHYASHSFDHGKQSYFIDGQSTIFSEAVTIRVYSAGYFVSAKNELVFSALDAASIHIVCKNLK